MKRGILFILLLGVVSQVRADFIITINDTPAPDQITITQNQILEVGMDWLSGYQSNFDIALFLSNSSADFELPYEDNSGPQPFYWVNFNPLSDYTLLPVEPFGTIEPQMIRVGGYMESGEYLTGSVRIFDSMVLNCNENTNVTLDLIVMDSAGMTSYNNDLELIHYDQGQVLDSITIVPEPLSLSLIALSGLALIRRR